MPQRWAFVAASATGVEAGELSAASARTFTAKLTGAFEAGVSLSGRSAQALLLTELESDLVVYLNGAKVFRGRTGATTDEIDEDSHASTFAALDYRALLDRRMLAEGDTLAYAGVDQGTIAWNLIQTTQAKSGGNLGITLGTGTPTGVTRTKTFEAGKMIGEAIAQLGDLLNGFDWEIAPDLKLNVFYPSRGTAQPFVLDYGGTVTRVRRAFDPGSFSNAIRGSGAQALTAENRAAAGIGADPRGRFESQHGYTDILEQATLSAKADFLLAGRNSIRPSWVVELRPGAWQSKAQLWVGDTAQLVVASGRVNVNVSQRVLAMAFSIDPSGAERIAVTLGENDLEQKAIERQLANEARLRNLENI